MRLDDIKAMDSTDLDKALSEFADSESAGMKFADDWNGIRKLETTLTPKQLLKYLSILLHSTNSISGKDYWEMDKHVARELISETYGPSLENRVALWAIYFVSQCTVRQCAETLLYVLLNVEPE